MLCIQITSIFYQQIIYKYPELFTIPKHKYELRSIKLFNATSGLYLSAYKTRYMGKQKEESVLLENGNKDIRLDYSELRKAVLVLRAVNHKLRQRIIDLLEENEFMTVTDIYIKLRLEQSVASQHLAILRRAGVVITTRDGKFINYSLNNDRIAQISNLVEELTNN